jgi:hypothetical protein
LEVVGIILVVGALWIAGSIWTTKQRREALMTKYGDAAVVENIMQKKIWQGMSHEQLVDSWGSPADTAEKVQRHRVIHTCKYGQTGKNRFNSRVTVENGVVTGWEQK